MKERISVNADFYQAHAPNLPEFPQWRGKDTMWHGFLLSKGFDSLLIIDRLGNTDWVLRNASDEEIDRFIREEMDAWVVEWHL